MLPFKNSTTAQDYQWAKAFIGATNGTIVKSISTSPDGSVISAGIFYGTLDFDPGPGVYNLTSDGVEETYLSKLDSSGNFVWAIQIGNNGLDKCFKMDLDYLGNIYLTGAFTGTVDLDPGTGIYNMSSAGGDVYILKLDSGGNFIWAKQLITSASMEVFNLAINSTGDIYITGPFGGSTDFDPGAGTSYFNGTNDTYILKLNSAGNFVWKQIIQPNDYVNAFGIALNTNENVLIAGTFYGAVDINPGFGTFNITSAGGNDIFILKLDSSGAFMWAKTAGSYSEDECFSITTDIHNNLLLTGFFSDSTDFDPGPGSYFLHAPGTLYNKDIYVWKLDSTGNFVWAKSMGSLNYLDAGYSIKTTQSGSVVTVGKFRSSVDFDPGSGTINITSNALDDIFISCLDSSGQFLWAKGIGGPLFDVGLAIEIDSLDNIFIAGQFADSADFNPPYQNYIVTAAPFNVYTPFIAKYHSNTVGVPEYSSSAFSIYPNPFVESFTLTGFADDGNSEIMITNTQGQLIKKMKKNSPGDIVIEFSGPPGIYFAKIDSKYKNYFYKIVKL